VLQGDEVIEVGAKASMTLMAKNVLILETGSGGKYDPANERPADARARDEAEGYLAKGREAAE